MPIQPVFVKPRDVPEPPQPLKEPTGFDVPLLPEEAEHFPRFRTQLMQWGKLGYQAQERVVVAEQKLSKLKSQWSIRLPWEFKDTFRIPSPLGLPIVAPITIGYISDEEFARQRLEAQMELEAATRDASRFDWRQDVMTTAPQLMSLGDVRSAEDIMTAFPNEFLNQEDKDWLNDSFEKLRYLIPPALPPEYAGTPEEARTQLLNDILTEPKLPVKGVHNLTIDELWKYVAPTPGELPAGMTTEDVVGILKEYDADEEVLADIADLRAYTEEKLKAYKEKSAYINLVRAGLLTPEAPDLTPIEFLKMLATQPAMASLELLEKYFNMLPRPLAAKAIMAAQLNRIEPDGDAAELERLYQQHLAGGANSWDAASLAYQDWDSNIWSKMLIETVFDPTTYIGLGIATKITKPFGRLGHFVGAIERGWLEAWDVPFRGARAMARSMPKTNTMMAQARARQAYKDLRALVIRLHPGKTLENISAVELKEAVEFAIREAFSRPQEADDIAVRVGRHFMEQDFVEEATVRTWLKNIGKEADITVQNLADINYATEGMMKKASPSNETAARIVNALGIDPTEEVMTKMNRVMTEYKEAAVKNSTAILRGETAPEMLRSVLANVNDLLYSKYNNPIYTHMRQAGRTASMLSRVTDKIIKNNVLNAIDRKVTAPMANQYLLFMNLGPVNYLENMTRSWLGGGELLYPRRFAGVSEATRLFEGLSNAPYELFLAERGLGRLEMAIVQPVTGETLVFGKGKIPFITRNVTIKGTTVGKSINIAGRDYMIASAQSWHDMWGSLTDYQRAWDYIVHFKKALRQFAPDQVGMIDDVLAKNRNILDNVGTISKGDANDIERTLWQDAIVGPESIRKHDIPVMELQRRRASKELGKTLDKCNDVRKVSKNGIREEVLDGSIFNRIDERIAAYKAGEQELQVISLQNEIDMLNQMVTDFTDFVPRDSDELIMVLREISDMTEGLTERVGDVRSITRSRASKLTGGERDDFYEGSAKLLDNFIESANESVGSMLEHVRSVVKRDVLDWSKVTFDEAITSAGLVGEARSIIDKMPVNMRFNVEKIGIRYRPDFAAYYDSVEKAIYFSDAFYVKPRLVHHELAHDFIFSRLLRGGRDADYAAGLLSEFNKLKGFDRKMPVDDVILSDIARTTDTATSYRNYKQVHEDFSDDFADWLDSPKLFRRDFSQTADLFDQVFPLKAYQPTDVHLDSIVALTESIQAKHASTMTTRTLDRGIFTKYMDKKSANFVPKNKRDNAFWERLEVERNTVWEPWHKMDEELTEAMENAKNQVMVALGVKTDTPTLMPEVVGKLTPSHVAYLVGSTGDDLHRGLTKYVEGMILIKPRNKFVNWVYSRARKSAAKVNKLPEDIGFSKDAIGDVYDQMFDVLGIDSKLVAQEPMTPTMMQLDDIGTELNRLKDNLAIPDNDYLKYREYISAVADDVEKLPMYAKIKEPEVALKPISPTEPNVLEITYKGRPLVGTIETIVRVDSLLVRRLAVDEPHIMSKEFLLAVSDALDDAARTKGLKRVKIEFLERHRKMYESAGFRRAITELEPGFMVRDVPPAPTVPPEAPGAADWWNVKEKSMTEARVMHELAYPTYDDFNVVDSAMRMVFPFWTYESFRWQWLPRTFTRTPGVATAAGRYTDYTEQGYIPIPGTDLQANPLRGSVMMGGFRRLYMRDFPEYYDAFPGMEAIDYIGRLGFYPGFPIMSGIVAYGAWQGKPELGEIAPAYMKTGLDAARAIAPEAAGRVIDHFFPDRFRDYQTMLTLGEMGYDADEIWRKKRQDAKLTPEEEKLWFRAEAKATGWKGVLMEQTGIFRIRPDEYSQLIKDDMALIEALTGVPVRVQEVIYRRQAVTGKRFSDYYYLDELQRKIMYQSETHRRWQGMTTPLYPSTWQLEDVKVKDYYERVELLFDEARHIGIFDEQGNLDKPSVDDLTAQWVRGTIGPDQWITGRSDILSYATAASTEMGKKDFPDVPKTLDEREARLKERGIPAPTYGPDQELLYKYFELKPELKWDWERDRDVRDFDAYYAKIDAMIDTLEGEYKQRFIDRIQFEWNPLERLHWQVTREYIHPYNMLRNLVLEQYTEEQKQLILRYEVARGAEREGIKEVIGPEGDKLISHFTRQLRESHVRLRMLEPKLDAWLYFFGTTDAFVTKEAEGIYNDLTKEYMTQRFISKR